jgi:hypothetical protein
MVALACDATTPDPLVSMGPKQFAGRQRSMSTTSSSVAKLEQAIRDVNATVGKTRATLAESQALDVGAIRVTGYTRHSVQARVHFDGRRGRLVPLSGIVLRTERDSAIVVITPATFRVEGKETYRIVAEAQENEMEVEIAAVFPESAGFPTMGAARGPAPGVRFPGSQRIADAVKARNSALESLRRLPGPEVDTTVVPAAVEPGQIRFWTPTGASVRVTLFLAGAVKTVNGVDVSGLDSAEALTPILVEFTPGVNVGVGFIEAGDSTHMFHAYGAAVGSVVRGTNYPRGLVICQTPGTFGIRGFFRKTSVSQACKF